MFIENVCPSQNNPDDEQIILKLWKVRNKFVLLFIFKGSYSVVILITYYKPHAKRRLFANSLIHLRSVAVLLGKHLFSGSASCKYPVSFRLHVFFFSLPWGFHLNTVFPICNAFNI